MDQLPLSQENTNDSNVLCLGSWLSSQIEMREMSRMWLEEAWGEGRHQTHYQD